MTDDEADTLIDAQLRNVAVPAGLADRLRCLSEWPDDEVDRGLTDLGVPVLLSSRLKSISLDSELDEELCEVSLPTGLRARLRKIAAGAQVWRALAMRSLAASLLLAASLGYAAFAWQILFGARDGDAPPQMVLAVMRPAGVELNGSQAESVVLTSADDDEGQSETPRELLVSASPTVSQLPERDLRPRTPVEEVFSAAQAGRLDRPLSPPVLGAPLQDDLPQLELVPLPESRGVVTPIVPGYNRKFLLRSGVHPPIFTGLNPALQQSLAPLSTSTESFDQTRELLAANERIPADRVRTEDFVAAVEHGLPKPAPGELSLSALGSVSPFGPDRAHLLGLGVRAGEAVSRTRASTHLVIALDFSAGLGRSGHWPWVSEALLESVGRLSGDDRISLVFYQDEILMASAPLQQKDTPLLRQRLSDARPQGDVDPAVGLEAALDVALAAETPAATRRIAVLTDGHFELAAPHYRRLQKVAAQTRAAGIDLDILQLGGERSVAQGAEAVSRATQTSLKNFDSRRQLVDGVLNLLHGDEAIAAREVKLVVRFMPDAVAAYRLIGHEANTMAQLSPPAQVVELRAGAEALVLFELLPSGNLAGGNAGHTVAEVELSWLTPSASERRTQRHLVSRSEIMQPWDATPTAFRAVTVAAELAEQLRGSRAALRELRWFGNDRTGFDDLRDRARSLRLSSDAGSLEPLLSLLDTVAERPERRR